MVTPGLLEELQQQLHVGGGVLMLHGALPALKRHDELVQVLGVQALWLILHCPAELHSHITSAQ